MDSDSTPHDGERFQWNAGAWFGSLLGLTSALFAGSSVLFSASQGLAITWFACGAAVVGLAVLLWSKRDSVRLYPALQGLVACAMIAHVIAFYAAKSRATDLTGEIGTGGVLGFGGGWPFLLIFPVLMLLFALLERSSRSERG